MLDLSDPSFAPSGWSTDDVALAVGETKTIIINEANSVTAAGEAGVAITNTATAVGTATDSFDNTWTDTKSDDANYNVINPALQLKKYVGYDADKSVTIDSDEWWDAQTQAEGLKVLAGTSLTVKFVITNTGDTPLSGVEAFDSVDDADPTSAGTLGVGETEIVKEIGPAQAGWHHDVGVAETTKTDDFGNTTDVTSNTDPAHYFGATLSIDIEKKVSLSPTGPWSDSVTVPLSSSGSATIYYHFIVKNNSNVPLENVVVTDPDLNETVTIGHLDIGQQVTVPDPPLSRPADFGTHSNTAKVTGDWTDTYGDSHETTDSDTVSYQGLYKAYTPGYWKNHPEVWESRTGYIPYDYKVNGTWHYATKVKDVFTVPSDYSLSMGKKTRSGGWLGDYTLMQALAFPGGDNLYGAAQNLLRVGTGALLNAKSMERGYNTSFPWGSARIISEVNTALASHDRQTMIDLASMLDAWNNGTHTGL